MEPQSPKVTQDIIHMYLLEEKVRPRAITFSRKGLRATQIFPTERTVDYCFVQISGITFVNVYRAPSPTGTLEPLLRWQPQGLTVVGGDFNAVSQHWQPQAQRQYGNCGQILGWATAHGLEMITTIGEPTHRDGNVLDLTWSDASAFASVTPLYHCTSDHCTIEGTVYTPGKPDLTRIASEVHVSDANLDDFARCVERWAKLGQLKTVKAFRKAVKAAKREYWTKQIEASETEAQVFKLMRWAKPRPVKEPSPLQVSPDRWLSDPYERAIALRDSLLARFNANNDSQTWEHSQPETIPWNSALTLEEVTAATTAVRDTAPGSDKITVRLLKACWKTIGPFVRDLYQACLRPAYVPLAFKVAEVVLLPKAGRDISTTKGWRPISLLSSLAKGLE
ncbi:hypothetical protein K3495_g12439 [Podosphaera aphanis]|nr:hypothetical protein K3495_g12439 [Podosphaera aphanis]